ncbi:Acetylcholinesterase [Strongyloides ratti]|uniref:Acetylcholinesterase n=1 Tax=Strongyloides ratti TaxID=34506 RepID=A0A090LJL1_STRRB|nr:Acetylcholinesterase [Strongyloides ratti]CEF69903.1 Acetylcholinesterase [Strongyloides ratti]
MIIIVLLQFSIFIKTVFPIKYVTTRNGPIAGIEYKLFGNTIYEYLGVPFAKPPIKNLRFKSPEPLDEPTWTEPFIANKPANACIQGKNKKGYEGMYVNIPESEQSEDCLQLNMWVPKKPSGAVLIFIFGGGFRFGSPSLDIYNGSVIASKTKSIVVNLNYRLGIFGFSYMCCGIDFQGNMGLLDQQMGMRWVYNNIKQFGGDPKKITLWGSGAGSASVTAHLFSHDSYKYFKRIIATSGVITNIWARHYSTYIDDTLRFLSKKYNCFGNHRHIYNCLSKLNTSQLANESDNFSKYLNVPFSYGFNIVEKDEVFFKKSLYDKLASRDIKHNVDILLGRTKNEGTYFLPIINDHNKFGCKSNNSKLFKYNKNTCQMNKKHLHELINSLQYTLSINSTGLNYLKRHYFLNNTKSSRDIASTFLSHIAFDCDIIDFAKKCSFYTDGYVFSYVIDVKPSANKWPNWMGSVHGVELEYAFGLPYRKPKLYKSKLLKIAKKFSNKLMEMFKNFAKKGNPGFGWSKFDPYNIKYNKIDFSIALKRTVKKSKETIKNKCKIIRDYTSKYVFY